MKNVTWVQIAILPVMTFVIIGFVYLGRSDGIKPPVLQRPSASIPDFSEYTDVSSKKQAFFYFMLPNIRNANAQIAAERQFLRDILEKSASGQQLSTDELETAAKLFSDYRLRSSKVPVEKRLERLLKRVDTVPASLVLAQAAKESAWGTSRFARTGNNYFGIWCFQKGCGQVPRQRTKGMKHEVKRFKSIEAGVKYYLYTLNTHSAYQDLRDRRAEARRQNRQPRGLNLAEGLHRYAQRGEVYVQQIKSMIRQNQLQRFTLTDS